MKIIKRVFLFVCGILCMLTIFGCTHNDEISKYPIIYDYFDSITLDTFYQKINNNDTFVVYVARPTCSDCEILDDRLINDSSKNEVINKVLYLNISSIHSDKEEWGNFKKNYNIQGTPSFIFFEKGEIIDVYGWTKENGFDYERFKKWLSTINF